MKRSAGFILTLLIFSNIWIPLVLADTDTFRPELDESGQCVHGSLGGEFDDYGWAIFIGNDQFDTAAGIRFPNITIDQGEIINQANLTVYYPGGFDWDTGTLYLLIYGYDADDAPTDLTWSNIVNGPRTEALTVFNMSLMNVTGSYVIDVTDHVQEIVNRYNWENGNAIAFTTLHILEDDMGEYWYEWASNTGAYKNHRPSLTIRYSEEPTTGPGEGYNYNGTYQGYDIWFYNDTVNYYGLDNPNYWVPRPISQTDSGCMTQEASETYETDWVPNGPYGEVWGNETYEGNFYDYFFEATLYNGEFGLSTCSSSGGTYSGLHHTKVNLFVLMRTYGAQTSSLATMGYVAGVSEYYSGSWLNRQTNDAPIVATGLISKDNTHITLEPDVILSTKSTPTTLDILENRAYLMRFSLAGGMNKYGGTNYLYHYRNVVFYLNESTGEVSNIGNVQIHFNMTQDRFERINRWELAECYGSGSTDAYIQFYVGRGFIPEIDYNSYFEIWKNGTKIDELPENSTLEDIQDLIDDLLDTTDPENPGAGGQWSGSEPWYIDRQRTQLYFTFIGLMCIIPPWIIAAQKRRIDIIVTAIFLNLIGIALLYGVSYI